MARKSNDNSKNTHHIGEAIQEMLKSYHLKSRFDEATVVSSWERLVGKPIARRTKRVAVRDKVLFVELDSPSMKQDISLHKAQILEVFAREFGKDVIKEIVIM